jgi:hypothetical protein
LSQEFVARPLHVIGGDLQGACDPSIRVVGEAVAIRDRHEEQVEENLVALEAIDPPIAHETPVDPGEARRNPADSIRNEDPLLNLFGPVHGRRSLQ